MKSIEEIVEPEIRLVEDTKIREVLIKTYHESEPALESIQSSLDAIMGQRWPTQALYLFFKNWRNPAIGAGSFCALTCRLLEEADKRKTNTQAQRELLLSAARIAEVSYEGMGGSTAQIMPNSTTFWRLRSAEAMSGSFSNMRSLKRPIF